MAEDQPKPGREAYSVERLEEGLRNITKALTGSVWTHLEVLCDIVGQDISPHPLGPKPGSEDPGVPMIRIFDDLHDLKEIVNQFDIHMNNLAHDLHPTGYDKDKTSV